MKEGYYTIINGKEYEVIRNSRLNRGEVYLRTKKGEDVDDSFIKDGYGDIGSYIKLIDSSTLGDVFEYRIEYYYNGFKVGKKGWRGNKVVIELNLDDGKRDFAYELGFDFLERGVYTKEVDESEVKMIQIGPIPYYRFKK